MTRARLRLALLLGSVVAMSACVPARIAREVASFQRQLDRELADALRPREGPGLEAACHRHPIVWMHFVADGERWRLLSVDDRGQVGIWSERGLEQTWSLRADELEWVRQVVTREDLSEDAQWLRARAKLQATRREDRRRGTGDIAPRDRHRWLGIPQVPLLLRTHERRITTSGDWYAVGDGPGNLEVARVPTRRRDPAWSAPGCEPLSRIGVGEFELVTNGEYRDQHRHIDLRRGLHALLPGGLQLQYELEAEPSEPEGKRDDFLLGHGGVRMGDRGHDTWGALAELLEDEPALIWRELRITRSPDDRWLAAASETGWVIRDRMTGTTHRIEITGASPGAFAAISSSGTLATAHWDDSGGFVELVAIDGARVTHRLPAAPAGLAFLPGLADADDTLWIEVSDEWESFAPIQVRLLRLDPGGVLEQHAIAGFDAIDRVVGHMPGPIPTLAVTHDGAVGIQRLDDGEVLRVVVHDRRVTWPTAPAQAPTADGLSLIWLDRTGQRRCRHDGGLDDHVPRREPRIADAGELVEAFLSGRDCPG